MQTVMRAEVAIINSDKKAINQKSLQEKKNITSKSFNTART